MQLTHAVTLISERALHPLMHQTAVKTDGVTSANRFMVAEQFRRLLPMHRRNGGS